MAPLPMPPKRLNSVYIVKLFEGNNDKGNNDNEGRTATLSSPSNGRVYNVNTKNDDDANAALAYLTQVRGLDQSTLRKYGVGCARYNFPNMVPSSAAAATTTPIIEKTDGGGGGGGISYMSSTCVNIPVDDAHGGGGGIGGYEGGEVPLERARRCS